MSTALAFHWTTAELAWVGVLGTVVAAVVAAIASYFAGRKGSRDAISAEHLRISSQHALAEKEQRERRALSADERAERRRLSFQERMWDRKVDAYDNLMHVCNQLTRAVMNAQRVQFISAADDLLRVVGPIAVLAPDALLVGVNQLQRPVWKVRFIAAAAPNDLDFAHAMEGYQNDANALVQAVGTLHALMKRDLARDMELKRVTPPAEEPDPPTGEG